MSEINFNAETTKSAMTRKTGKFELYRSEKVRLDLSKKQQKEITDLYSRLTKVAEDEAKRLESKSTTSSILRRMQLNSMKKELAAAIKELSDGLKSDIKSNMHKVAESVVEDNKLFLDRINFTVEGAYNYLPKDIVEKIVTGKVYAGDWSLNKSIWAINKKTQSDINKVVAEGISLNKSSYDIAKDLEKYVDPKARKDWKWSKVYPGTNKTVDYNAQRLARTLTSHAYQQSLIDTTKDNPFVTGIQWRSAEIHNRTCEVCRERNGKIYAKDELPLDHPNGICTFIPVVEKSFTQIGDEIGDWLNGKSNSSIDKWWKSFGLNK